MESRFSIASRNESLTVRGRFFFICASALWNKASVIIKKQRKDLKVCFIHMVTAKQHLVSDITFIG